MARRFLLFPLIAAGLAGPAAAAPTAGDDGATPPATGVTQLHRLRKSRPGPSTLSRLARPLPPHLTPSGPRLRKRLPGQSTPNGLAKRNGLTRPMARSSVGSTSPRSTLPCRAPGTAIRRRRRWSPKYCRAASAWPATRSRRRNGMRWRPSRACPKRNSSMRCCCSMAAWSRRTSTAPMRCSKLRPRPAMCWHNSISRSSSSTVSPARRAWRRRFPITSGLREPALPTPNMRCRRYWPTASAAGSATRPKPAAG